MLLNSIDVLMLHLTLLADTLIC